MFQLKLCTPQNSDCDFRSSEVTYTPYAAMSCVAPTKEIIKKVMDKIRNLEEFPLMGKPLANLIDVPTDYLYLVTEKNYVFFHGDWR